MKMSTVLPERLSGLLIMLAIPGLALAQARWTAEQQAVIDAVRAGPIGIETDFDAWADGYADGWTYWRVGDTRIRDRETHMARVRDFIDAGNRPTAFSLEPVDVRIRGEIALLRSIATEHLKSARGEERIVRYASATVLERIGGRWIVLATNIVYLDDA